MSQYVMCAQCGDLYPLEMKTCPTCGRVRSGSEVVVARGGDVAPVANGVPSVVVKDFDMPFTSMVSFMVKWAIAAIPALIILFILFAVFGAVLGGFFASLLRSHG